MLSKYYRRCFDLARLGNGYTSPNPSVGSVITCNHRVIGEGWHRKYGDAHAEVNAFLSISDVDSGRVKDSSIYVSLEPCFHYGKTPPCVDLILENKVKKVNIVFKDPNPLVSGKSVNKLLSVDTKINIINNTHTENYSQKASLDYFFTNLSLKRPYIILKWAESSDNFIGNPKKRVQISNEYTKRLVHKWRSEVDAIMVGYNTVKVDDPLLTNRFYHGKSPIRVVIDRDKTLDSSFKVFNHEAKTMVYNALLNKTCENIEYTKIDFDNDYLKTVLNDLYEKKIAILLVEGGAKLLSQFIEQNLWDEARILKSNTCLTEGVAAPALNCNKIKYKLQIDDNQLLIFRNS